MNCSDRLYDCSQILTPLEMRCMSLLPFELLCHFEGRLYNTTTLTLGSDM